MNKGTFRYIPYGKDKVAFWIPHLHRALRRCAGSGPACDNISIVVVLLQAPPSDDGYAQRRPDDV